MAPLTAAERDADFQKRKIEQAEKDKKAADTARQSADQAANCEKIRSYSRMLEAGARVTTPSPNGERSFMSDEERAAEMRKTRRIVSACN